jgi:hypothetical protein
MASAPASDDTDPGETETAAPLWVGPDAHELRSLRAGLRTAVRFVAP